jgi:hypothetical protein
MDPFILLDVTLLGALLVLIIGYIVFQVSQYKWLKTYGTDIGALITQVRRENIEHQACMPIASWTDPRTGRTWTFKGFRLDLGYHPGQLVGILLDPKHPSRYIMQ